jgi:hypothetical protein
MDGKHIVSHFGRIGARVRVRQEVVGGLRLNILRDEEGQFFDVIAPRGVDARVVDVEEGLRHLLLLGVDSEISGRKTRFLCGHDEREWFVAAVPGDSVSRVRQAMEALKPAVVRFEQERKGVRGSKRLRRRTAAYIRQGEWFFLPRPRLVVQERFVLRNEPLSRGFGKPHWAEFLYREGGQTVMVSSTNPQGLSLERYRDLIRAKPATAARDWRPMRANATVYVKGRVRHPDHATIRLDGWHQVVMNTEGQAPGARNVVFLD